MKKNHIKRGASATSAARKRHKRVNSLRNRGRQFARALFVTTSVTIVGAVGYLAYQWFEGTSVRPVATVVVSGNFQMTSREAIEQMISPLLVNGELQAPLEDLKTHLESMAWVDQASVNWRWPDQLRVSVVEQVPIARWGNGGFLNHKGEVIRHDDQSLLRDLPLLSGSDGQEKLIMQNFEKLSQLLRESNLHIAELTCDPLMNWELALSNGAEITIGRNEVMKKVQRFMIVYNQGLRKDFHKVTRIDLRYGNGVAVAWNQAEKNQATDMQLAQVNERRGG